MRKRSCIIANIVLLGWFFLDMVGLYFGELYLVTRSWKDDGIFFLIFLISLLLFIFKERVGKYILAIWLGIWLVTQLLSHELFTIIGGGEGKIRYFEGSIKLINSNTLYIPDLYHIILHVLILIALITTLLYSITLEKKTYMTKS
jgi:hypothetical protein